MAKIDERRAYSEQQLTKIIGKLNDAEKYLLNKQEELVACVYATGSFGRREASDRSDLDLFIAGRPLGRYGDGTLIQRELSQLDEICLKAELVEVTRSCGLPEFDGDGEYLRHYTGAELIHSLGRPEDDLHNTFTARLLLLLESAVLIGPDVYDDLIQSVIASYWRDFEDHKKDFVPTFLVNDILRLWRTLTVGYEAKTKSTSDEEKAKRREKNYKLKHSRVLTCFSTIICLTAITDANGTVTPFDMEKIAKKPPLDRLRGLRDFPLHAETISALDRMMEAYEKFLSKTEDADLRQKFLDDTFHRLSREDAGKFGDAVFDTILSFGPNNRLVRILIV